MIEFSVIDTISETENSKVFLASAAGYDIPVIIKEQKNLNLDVLKKISGMKNPHIPRLFQFEETDGTYILVEEYVEGETLDVYFQKNKPDKAEQRELFLQICDALKCLHDENPPIIHRDIKPENILISGDGFVHLIDFNASREFKENAEKDTISIGTKSYAPPEQYGFSQTDVRSDIYSLGVVIGEQSGEFQEIVKRCTMFSPEERYSSVDEMIAELQTGFSSRRQGGLIGAGRNTSKKKIAIICLVSFLLLAASMGIGLMRRSRMEATKQETKKESSSIEQKSSQEKKEQIIDRYNAETGKMEKYIYYILYDAADQRKAFSLGIPFSKENPVLEIRYKKSNGLTERVVSKKRWRMTDAGIDVDTSFLYRLDKDTLYDIVAETKEKIIGFRLCLATALDKIPHDYQLFCTNPGWVEYLRVDGSDKTLFYHGYGRSVTKIVNQSTKKPLTAKDYTVDEEREMITFKKRFLESLQDDKHIILRIYHTKVAEIEEEEYLDIDAVTREDPYQPPELASKEFIYNKAEDQDLEIRLTWNDGEGHLQEIYSQTENVSNVGKSEYRVTEKSIIISKKYMEKLDKGEYGFVLEFGDIGKGIFVKVI